MKLSFTKKLILTSVDRTDVRTTLRFISYLKEDFIERILKITLADNNVESIYISSNKFGTANWTRKDGFVESHSWETDDGLKDISYLSSHYPSLLENGRVSSKYTFEKIVPDVLENLIDPVISNEIKEVVGSSEQDGIFDWEESIKRNIELSKSFLEKHE